MRTGTKFFNGENYGEFAAIFNNYYSAGKVAVIASEKTDGDELIRALGSDYNALLYSSSRVPDALPDGVRFLIGIGGTEVISKVKNLAKGRKFAFIPDFFDYRFLCSFDGIFALPEFVFLSEKARSDKRFFCERLYENVFVLYAECVIKLYYGGAYPYGDCVAETYKGFAERVLRGRSSKEDFLSEGIRFVAGAVNYFYGEKTRSLITDKVSGEYGNAPGDAFLTAYFLILMLKNFTKRPFRDILLPSERPVVGVKSIESRAFDESVLPTDEELKGYYRKISFLVDMNEPDTERLLDALGRAADENSPVFAIINNEGITDALKNEKPERHFCISI